MSQIFRILSLFFLCWTSFAIAGNQTFVEGKQYHLVTNAAPITQPSEKVQVIEFFNYGCPACNHLEPSLEKWLAHKPAIVEFTRVPVVFEDGWEIYAKAYYLAKALHVESKLSPELFNAIHKNRVNLSDPTLMEAFFINHDVKAADVRSAFDNSPAIELGLNQGSSLAQTYQISLIPTFIVGGKYKVSANDVQNETELINVLNYLIKKVKNG